MNKSRLKFDKEVLDKIFSIIKENTTLIELSTILNVGYRTLKSWKAGKANIPEYHFQYIIQLFPDVSKFEKYAQKLPYFWGTSIGGKNTILKLSKEELNKKMTYIRSFKGFKEIEIINTTIPNQIAFEDRIYSNDSIIINIDNDKMLEFYGVLMGDGCISKYKSEGRIRGGIFITGNSKKDLEYFNYLRQLINELFDIKVNIKIRKDCNCVIIVFANKSLIYSLERIGFPIGVKGQISIPEQILNLPKDRLNNLIRGFFDTDGCISARKDEKYRYPHIILSTTSKPLREQLKKALREQGLNACIHDIDVRIRGNKNFRRWFEIIGSNNPRNLNRYYEWLRTGKIESVGSWSNG